ncbi:Na+/H+ antiporter subunit E [Marivirga sp. S37H4]|uniref:Na+/H+ antiporter subunit E n=1 Tax=Marivirga aurantiaca TaxID=2802615 RepID=A0A934WY65_9BACT|nr:Na+/H+ antiporter subunit E [Marivirga aurantiaca]MBK6264965.1 Na+/H+ antiporter subunit E [Marivirga aurantiaca]
MRTFIIHLTATIILGVLLHDILVTKASGIAEFCIYLAFMLLLWLTSWLYNRTYFRQFKGAVLLFFYLIKELFVSNLKVIYYVITPGLQFRPAILELPLDIKSEAGIALLANMITLTPGTLTLEISEDRKFLYYHTLNVPDNDLEEAKRQVKEGFEKRIMAIVQ